MSVNHKLILLFGMPRSGTTWIGKIFDSHPETLYMHEPDSWQHLDNIPLFPMQGYSGDGLAGLNNMISGFPEITTAQVTSKLPIFKKSYQSLAGFYTYNASLYCSSICHKFGISKQLNPVKRVPSGWDRSLPIVWKSIESLGRLPFFAENLKSATCIHIVRNPAGYISSVMSGEVNKLFQGATPSSEDYDLFQMLLDTKQGHSLGYSLADVKALDPVERLAIRWRLYNEIAYENSKGLENYKVILYEDICREPVEKTQELFNFSGLEWNEQTALFLDNSTTQNKDSYYSVYKSPLEAAYKWKNKLTKDEIAKIANILSDSIAFSWYANDF